MGLKVSRTKLEKVSSDSLQNAQYSVLRYMIASNFVRSLVSKHRRRMLVAGYDLDMSYITDKILAMSFPAERMRAFYRNPLWQVKSVLDMRHGENYKIYNLCIEENYDPAHFHGRVETYPFDDNHVPPLHMVKLFCESVHSWLSQDPKNIAVIHCMAGKGRTGLMVCAYLVYIGFTAEEALQLYANKRTTNNQGVSIPSQRRYVGYWENLLSYPQGIGHGPREVTLPESYNRELRRIRLYDTVNIDSVFFVVSELQEISDQLYRPSVEIAKNCCRPVQHGQPRNNSPLFYVVGNDDEEGKDEETKEPRVVIQMDTESPVIYKKKCLEYYFDKTAVVKGDVRVIFYEKMIGGRVFYVCFNTAFIKNSLLQFSVQDLDKVGKRGKSICGSSFCLELLFGPSNSSSSLFLNSSNNGDFDDLTDSSI